MTYEKFGLAKALYDELDLYNQILSLFKAADNNGKVVDVKLKRSYGDSMYDSEQITIPTELANKIHKLIADEKEKIEKKFKEL